MEKISNRYNAALAALIFLENFFLFYTHRHGFTQTQNAIAYFVTGVVIGVVLLSKFYDKAMISAHSSTVSGKLTRVNVIVGLAMIILAAILTWYFSNIFSNSPISPKSSDIIPIIRLMVRRFIAGEYVYGPSYDFGYLLSPTYLPLQWLPFTISETAHFDYRWVATAIFLIALMVLAIRLVAVKNAGIIKLSVPLLICFFCILMVRTESFLIAQTVELMIAGYYILLVITLNQRNPWLTAIAMIFCLLSRFSLVLWLPLWALVMWLGENKHDLIKIMAYVIFLVVAIYVIPFLSKDWSAFSNSMQHYTRAAVGEWGHNDINGKPYALYNGAGLAHLFYESNNTWEIADKVARIKKVHFIMSLGTSLLLGIWYWFHRKKIDYRIFLMGSFKIYLAVFLAFIQVPYTYLMIVANFVSIAIFAEQLRYRPLIKENNEATA